MDRKIASKLNIIQLMHNNKYFTQSLKQYAWGIVTALKMNTAK